MAGVTQNGDKSKVGRPLLFESVEELRAKIDAYFADCNPHPAQEKRYEWNTIIEERQKASGATEEYEVHDFTRPPNEVIEWTITKQKPYTITGLAVFLNTSRRTLINYEQKDGDFFHTIKAAKDRIEQYWELQLLGPHATGPIFNLKNNYEWQDQQQVEHSGHIDRNTSEENLDAIINRGGAGQTGAGTQA